MKEIDHNTKVSVIIPIYNAQDYLEKCVNSVKNQTYKNLQIILINDGSTDNSWQICQKLRCTDNRIETVIQKNNGVSVARNNGLKLAKGKWIMFVDPDDILSPNIVKELLLKVESRTDIIACCCYGFCDKRKIVDYFFSEDRDFDNDKTDLYLQLLNPAYGQPNLPLTAIGVPWGKLYRRSFLEKYDLKFDPKLRRMQDNLFNMYSFYNAREIRYVNIPLYFYRLSHINNYIKNNLSKIEQVFLPVLKARYIAINRLGLNSDTKIYNEYINETANIFLSITQSIVLTNTYKNINKKINNLITKKYIQILFSEKKKIKKNKVKFKLYLVRTKKYRIYKFITYILEKLKR